MGDNELFGKTLPQRGKCEMIEREQAKKRVAQRINLLVTDANPDKDYHKPHNLLLKRNPYN